MIAAAVRRLLALLTLSIAATAVFATPAASGADCPRVSFVRYDGRYYYSRGIPSGVELPPASIALGESTADRPGGSNGCKRTRETVSVVGYQGISPTVALGVKELPALVFVVNRCTGLTGSAYWGCLTTPLTFRGVDYTGSAYPLAPGSQRSVPLAGRLGTASLGDQRVDAARIVGVDPSVAVGIAGRPREAFLAPGVCPYERFDNRVAVDNLLRCLRSPVWMVSDPTGGYPGNSIVTRADRPIPAGRTIQLSLARLPNGVGNIVPKDLSGAVAIGTLGGGTRTASVSFDVPDVKGGAYEIVATCSACAAAGSGRTTFPAGVLLVGQKGSSSFKLIAIAIALAFVVMLLAALVVRRKGWTGRGGNRSRRPIG